MSNTVTFNWQYEVSAADCQDISEFVSLFRRMLTERILALRTANTVHTILARGDRTQSVTIIADYIKGSKMPTYPELGRITAEVANDVRKELYGA